MTRNQVRQQTASLLKRNGIKAGTNPRHELTMYSRGIDLLDRHMPELSGREYVQARQVCIEAAGITRRRRRG
jgi:FixJ family two-component response regulator